MHFENRNDEKNPNPLEAGTINGTPISVLLSQAVKIKTAQQATFRKKFDSFPNFLQNSIFACDDVKDARLKPFDERFETANRFKDTGNICFKEHKFYEAKVQYEKAISIFQFLTNINPSWKDVGIVDEDIREDFFSSSDYNEVLQVNDFLVTCFNNLALSCLNVSPCLLQDAIQSCDSAIKINPQHAKAYYLRCKARIGSKSAGREEERLALIDIRKAKSLDPFDKSIIRMYSELYKNRVSQKKKELKTFGNMFGKGVSLEYVNMEEMDKYKSCDPPHDETKSANRLLIKNRFTFTFIVVLMTRFLLICFTKSISAFKLHKNYNIS